MHRTHEIAPSIILCFLFPAPLQHRRLQTACFLYPQKFANRHQASHNTHQQAYQDKDPQHGRPQLREWENVQQLQCIRSADPCRNAHIQAPLQEKSNDGAEACLLYTSSFVILHQLVGMGALLVQQNAVAVSYTHLFPAAPLHRPARCGRCSK